MNWQAWKFYFKPRLPRSHATEDPAVEQTARAAGSAHFDRRGSIVRPLNQLCTKRLDQHTDGLFPLPTRQSELWANMTSNTCTQLWTPTPYRAHEQGRSESVGDPCRLVQRNVSASAAFNKARRAARLGHSSTFEHGSQATLPGRIMTYRQSTDIYASKAIIQPTSRSASCWRMVYAECAQSGKRFWMKFWTSRCLDKRF